MTLSHAQTDCNRREKDFDQPFEDADTENSQLQ